MIKKSIACIVLLVLSGVIFAQTADITYIDGWVDKKTHGEVIEALPGDVVSFGDSIITGDDSYAGLEQGDIGTITVKPNSIFTVQQIEGSKGKETVLMTTVGAVAYKFGKIAGKEPSIATPSMTAGIRGTEFIVYAGEDGSSLVAVTSGKVAVTAKGKTVDLVEDEGVEVKPGEAPGEKFRLKGRELDFSTWNNEKNAVLLANPIEGLKKMEVQLDGFIVEINKLARTLEDMKTSKAELLAEMKSIRENKGEDAASSFYNAQVYPIEKRMGPVYINIRYYALSALSYRRYVISKAYLKMKEKFITESDNEVFKEFVDNYHRILGKFENKVVPYLDKNDI